MCFRYVIFAKGRRKQILSENSKLSFPEITRLLGKEWSDMAPDLKAVGCLAYI